MTPGALPAPKFGPICRGELEPQVQVIQMLRRAGARGTTPWRFTGPGAKNEPSRTRRVERQIYVCPICSIRVVLHRNRTEST